MPKKKTKKTRASRSQKQKRTRTRTRKKSTGKKSVKRKSVRKTVSKPAATGKVSRRPSLAAQLSRLRRRQRTAFIAYVTAGDPNLKFTEQLVLTLAESGVDVIELGVPFSDPIADGPVIQRASERALKVGTTLSEVLKLAARIHRKSAVPLVLFSYYNPVLQMGVERFAGRAQTAGIDGVLITDLTPEEGGGFVKALRRHKLDTIFLVAPTSSPARLRVIAKVSRGFVYVIARRGVTGKREDVPPEVRGLIKRLRRLTKLPLAVGFGVSRREQVEALGAMADGVIVGSALVECCERHGHGKKALEAASALVQELKGTKSHKGRA